MANYKNTILITGGTTGLGYEASLTLAKRFPDHRIVIASRSHTDNAADTMNKTLHQSNVQFQKLDLSDLDQVRSFASNLISLYPPISHLLMNAGLQISGPVKLTAAGYESTFAINHMGHVLLFYLLMPHLTKDCHIAITASGVHDPEQKTGIPDALYTSAAELAHPNAEAAKNDGRQRYSTSKLCNVLWSYALDRRSKSAGKEWKINSFDPGLMPGTGLTRDAGPVVQFVWHHVLPRVLPVLRFLLRTPNIHTAAASGASLARLAIGEEGDANGASGKYFEGRRAIKSSKPSYELAKQDDLWEWTVKEVSRDEAERQKFERLQ